MNAPRRAAALLALAAALVARGPRSVRAEGSDAWTWLESADPRPEAVRIAPSLSPDEQAAGLEAWRRHTVMLAVTEAGAAPADGAADAAGVIVDAGGVVATSWRVVARAKARAGRIWARRAGGGWAPAVPVGETWYADLALLRLVDPRRTAYEPVKWAHVDRTWLGKRLLAVGSANARGNVVAAGTATAITWFDPATASGTVVTQRGSLTPAASRQAVPTLLHATDGLAWTGALGSGVFAPDGTCVGLVTARDPSRPDGENVTVRTADSILPFLERLLVEGTFAPASLGLRIGPPPAPPGVLVRTPVDVGRARDAKERGGAVVEDVDEAGPATGKIWPGEVVLAIGGRAGYYEVPDSIGLALLPLRGDEPVDVVVWRGAKKTPVNVIPAASRGGPRDPQDVHDDQGRPLVAEK